LLNLVGDSVNHRYQFFIIGTELRQFKIENRLTFVSVSFSNVFHQSSMQMKGALRNARKTGATNDRTRLALWIVFAESG
jgi:hypothetical protein